MITIKSFASGSSGNLYYVKNENTKILLECGFVKEFIIKKLWEYDKSTITDINALICSHIHSDHSKAICDLYEYGIKTYCSQQTKDKFCLKNAISLKNVSMFKVNTIDVMPIEVKHGDCECYGFILHDYDSLILFLTDFMIMDCDLSSFKFNEIYIETNYCEDKINNMLSSKDISDLKEIKLKRQINTHTSVENAIKYLKTMDLTNCKKIVGIHLSKEFANAKLIKDKLFEEFKIQSYCINSKGEII